MLTTGLRCNDCPAGAVEFRRSSYRLFAEAQFDRWIEDRCLPFYDQDESRGQRSIPPGVYFRMLLVGYFEGIDSQRGIAWRCADKPRGLQGFGAVFSACWAALAVPLCPHHGWRLATSFNRRRAARPWILAD